jgi:NAD(P)-dependent dehydrogenase (short-subunit alcohol dehydrogenase family)
MNDCYKDKIAVVTGGGTGIGLALAQGLARAGALVVLASTNAARLEDAAAAIRAEGGKAEAIVCNVAERSDVKSLVRSVKDRHGRIDFLFLNAGVTTSGPFLDHSEGDWDWIYDVVLHGVTNFIQTAYPLMVEQGSGQIIVTGSQAGFVPDWMLGHGPYTSAKSAVMALVMALRPEAARHGVKVSLFIPAGVATDILNSDRSRPENYGPSLKGAMEQREGVPPPMEGFDFFIAPEAVADIVLPAVARGEAIIVTHGGLKPMVADYFDRFLAAYDTAIAREEAGRKIGQKDSS